MIKVHEQAKPTSSSAKPRGGVELPAAPCGIGCVDEAVKRDRAVQLPYLDVIQRSFGPHDVTSVQAHAGAQASTAARALRAVALTTGEHVAFDGQPSLHTAAHEAAHVIQQRAGVSFQGVGKDGDAYERHADAVAQRVIAGQSSEALLGAITHSRPNRVASVVQLASWNSLYGRNADDKAKGLKAEMGTSRPGWSAASELETNGKKGTKVSGFKLTGEDILEVIKTAESERGVNHLLGKPGSPERAQHEAQISNYVKGMAAAFDVMEIDTIESQAAFVAHAVGETLLSRFTEAQTKLFVDDPKQAVVTTSLKTDSGDSSGRTGQILGPRRYRGKTEIDPAGVIPDIGSKMAAEDFNRTFIGRGPIQVTDRDNYMKTLMYMETRAGLLQDELDKAPQDRVEYREELTKKIALVREAIDAIKTDPTAAADPKYTFMFSAAFMHTSVLLQTTAGFGAAKDFSKNAGFGGGFKDDRGKQKTKAYAKAYELLIERNFGHQAKMPEQYVDPRKWHPQPEMP